MPHYLFLLLIFCFFQCADTAVQEELDRTKTQLSQTLNALDRSQHALIDKRGNVAGDLMHIVLFDVNPEADTEALISAIKTLKAIPEVKALEVGPFQELGDERALSDYELIMQVRFEDEAAYKTYQEHPIHKALKRNTEAMLAGPPVTYDFVSR